MDDTERIGRRIAATRKSLGLTQRELAAIAKVSKGMLAKVETGHATASTAWVGAVAHALGVDPGHLSGQPYVDSHTGNAALHKVIPEIRSKLASWDVLDVPDDLQQWELDDVAVDVRRLGQWRRATDYTRIGLVLPDVLVRLALAVRQPASDHDRERAFALLAMAYRAANTLAHKLGYTDLSLTALDRMEWAASNSGDPLLQAMVVYLRAGALGRIGSRTSAVRLLNRAITDVEPLAASDETARAVLGCLHMKLIGIYGAMSNAEMVNTHTAEATRIAASTGPDKVVHETVFGPVNVKLHALSAKVDLGRPGEALEVASSTAIPDGMAKERTTYFFTDLARAHLLNGEPDKAVEALYEARAVAPQHFRNSAVVRNAIYSIATEQRRSTEGLRSLAHSVGIRD